ncbi:MAG: hypothetical protein IPH12_21015 [Saprospirales bacterium]|nr:hypothetical protein [Saprospirales bacterium]MBK8922027.1 hypothetical protein [Saprospirales bacterium]
MGKGKWFFIGLLSLAPAAGRAQVRAGAAFDPARVEAGDTFALRVLVSGVQAAPRRVSFAAWHKQLPAANMLDRSEWTRSGAQWVQRFTLIAFDSIGPALPPLTVQLHLGDTVQTNAVELLVTPQRASSELSDMDDIRDIRREPAMWFDYWPWGLGGLLVLALLVRYLRRKRWRRQPVPAPVPLAPPPPARETALQKLAALEREKPWKQGRLLEYYAVLSLIVREYLEGHYRIPALESTTREITGQLKNTDFPDTQKPALEFLLQQADLVKFAEMHPPETAHELALENARHLIEAR